MNATFDVHDRVRATLGPSSIIGEVVYYQHTFEPHLSIRPDGTTEFTSFDIWANDGWTVEHIVEVTG